HQTHHGVRQPVDVFMGVPHAAPHVGNARFSPTMSPLPWSGIRRCMEAPPACPQPLVPVPPHDVGDKDVPPLPRLHFLKAVRPLLMRQNEDCLYLNIYTPHD
ncbi:unnamed protein product, partial [Meganyctiphanes norvegica]